MQQAGHCHYAGSASGKIKLFDGLCLSDSRSKGLCVILRGKSGNPKGYNCV